jgi:adenylosuccinate synthase
MNQSAKAKGLDVLLGLQWGDEGKGKIVDVLSPSYDIVARFQGGPNAGHTLEFQGSKHVLHLIPSGIFRKETLNVIGSGVIIDPFILMQEIDQLKAGGLQPEDNLLISRKAHLILPSHRLLDAAQEAAKGKDCIGSTLKGIGPAYAEKISRHGLRVGDVHSSDFREKYARVKEYHLGLAASLGFNLEGFLLDRKFSLGEYEERWMQALQRMSSLRLIDSEHFINQQLDEGKRVLAEGAQGTMLDIDFGSYPFVTSSNTTVAGVCSGLGVAPSRIGNVFGIVKAYCTRVGSGPFPTELFDSTGQALRDTGREYGSTTGRPRRCGWLDMVALRYAVMLNGVTHLFLMKTDVLDDFPVIKVCTEYLLGNETINHIPYDLGMPGLEPVYTSFEGWEQALGEIPAGSNLPVALNDYIRFIEHATGVPVSIVSYGPDREETIVRHNFVDLRAS